MDPNPYTINLGEGDPVRVISSTSSELSRLVGLMPPEQLAVRPPSVPWNVREIVAHLADCELVFGFRLRQTLAEDHPTLQPFDQDRWAARYGNLDLACALGLFEATRRCNLLLIEGTSAAERQRPATHPERGTMTFWTIVQTMAGHDINHLQRLRQMTGVTGA